MNNLPIGVFDSGVGGLTVVKEIMATLPNERVVYFGDTARVPYGTKSKELVTSYAAQIVEFLLQKSVKAIVVACGTVSSNAMEALRARFDIPLIEVVTPGAKAALAASKNGRIGVIGTEATVRSGAYERLLKAMREDIIVHSRFCPLFVPLVEEGWTNTDVTRLTAEIYLNELLATGIDTLVLGCTHYPLLIDCIHGIAGSVTLVNPAQATAHELSDFLHNQNMLRQDSTPEHEFYVSDNTAKFGIMAKNVLGCEYTAKMIRLD